MDKLFYPTRNDIGITSFPKIESYLDLELEVDVIDEAQYIPVTGDYVVELDYIPKVTTGAYNLWVDLATFLSVSGFTATVEGNPRTPVVTRPPGADEVFIGISQKPMSTRLIFPVGDKGKTALISYKGLYSNADCLIHHREIAAIQRIEEYPWLKMLALLSYSLGRFDDSVENDKKIWVTKSGFALIGRDGSIGYFPGMELNFGAGGNAEVGAFTTADYWKRLRISLDYDGSWIISVSESAEADLQTNLVTPSPIPGWISLGYIDVQNTGVTGTPGEILAITQDNIFSDLILFNIEPTPFKTEFWGDLKPAEGQLFGSPFCPGYPGTIESFVLSAETPGTAGDTKLDLLKVIGGNPPTETGLITDDADKPTISNSTDSYVKDLTPQGDFLPGELTFTADHLFKTVIYQAANGSKNFAGILYLRLYKF
jgi:hypothetical protein